MSATALFLPCVLGDWSHSWINSWCLKVVRTQPYEQCWSAVQPGWGHYQNGGVIHNGAAQGGKKVKTKEVGALARHLEGDFWEDHSAVMHSAGSSAHHANLSVTVPYWSSAPSLIDIKACGGWDDEPQCAHCCGSPASYNVHFRLFGKKEVSESWAVQATACASAAKREAGSWKTEKQVCRPST